MSTDNKEGNTDASGMTQEQLQYAYDHPAEHWQAVHLANMKAVENMDREMNERLGPMLRHHINAFKAIISALSRECVIHRTIETYIRTGKGGPEEADKYLADLEALRKTLLEEAGKAMQRRAH